MTSKKALVTKRASLPRPLTYSKKFVKDFERFNKAGSSDIGRLKKLMLLLIANDGPLEKEWKDHPLDKGEWRGTGIRDAHVHGDFLLLYRINNNPEEVVFERLGTHSELF